jgi:hypothetical protein
VSSDVLIAFVLDQTASMSPLVSSTIEGFNDFLAEQRKTPGATMTLTLFNSLRMDVRYVVVPLEKVPPLSLDGPNPYRVGGMTPLLDAVGTTIKGIEEWQRNHPDFAGRVLVTVLTDGEENASHEWHINHPMLDGDDKDLLGLIQWKQSEGWEFVFLGAGGSAWLEQTFGAVVGIDRILGYAHSPGGQSVMLGAVSDAVTTTRSTGRPYRVAKP